VDWSPQLVAELYERAEKARQRAVAFANRGAKLVAPAQLTPTSASPEQQGESVHSDDG
jgi:hypothetical protein